MQPDPDRVPRAVQHDRDLARIESLPRAEREHLLLRAGQTAERLRDLGQFPAVLGRLVTVHQVGPQTVGQRGPAALTAMVVGQHPPGHAVQPQPGCRIRRQILQPPPGGQEGIRDDVGGIVGILSAAQHVAQNRAVIRGVHRFETVPALIGVWWRTRQDGSLPGCSLQYQAHVRLPPSISAERATLATAIYPVGLMITTTRRLSG